MRDQCAESSQNLGLGGEQLLARQGELGANGYLYNFLLLGEFHSQVIQRHFGVVLFDLAFDSQNKIQGVLAELFL